MQIARLLTDFVAFDRACYAAAPLRAYQVEAARPILAAVDRGSGGAWVVLFARQAGKDELLARVQAYLLARYRRRGVGLVMAAPTFKPQCLISRRRLTQRCSIPLTPGTHSADGYRVVCGAASASFLSTEPTANARGETADGLLVANEAQDITCDIWDSRFMPMTASTNAPVVYSGTPWATGSLLSREIATADTYGTISRADWQRVAAEVPAYGDHVRARIAQLGPRHPFILTEYGLEELNARGGLFPPQRQAQMHGTHPRQHAATPGHAYALLLDVAGADEDMPPELQTQTRERKRDATALTVVEVGRETIALDLLRRPTYRIVDRYWWENVTPSALLPQLRDLALNVWHAGWLIGDATGIGAGLMNFLVTSLRGTRCEVVPFVFSQKSKSDLGWAFLGAIESGRCKDYLVDDAADTRLYWAQVDACRYDVAAGPGKLMRWSVPEAKGHDDLLISAALLAVLEGLDWRSRTATSRPREDVYT